MIRLSRGFGAVVDTLATASSAYGQATGNQSPQQVVQGAQSAMQAAQTAQAINQGTAQQKQDAAVAAATTAMLLIPGAAPFVPFVSAYYGIVRSLSMAFPAHGKFPVSAVADQMWQGASGCFDPSCATTPPLLGVWKQAVSTVQMSWDLIRQAKGMPAAPVAIRASLLLPLSSADRAPTGLMDMIGGLTSGDPMIQGADQCLLFWLNSYVKGWKTIKGCQQDLGKGRWAWVWNTEQPGAPEEGNVIPNDGRDPDVWWGLGPFGLKTDNWPKDCSSNTQLQFAECVRDVWKYRLDALTKALPEVLGAVMAQVTSEQNAGVKLASGIRLSLPKLATISQPAAKASPVRASTSILSKLSSARLPSAKQPEENALVSWAKGLPQVAVYGAVAALLLAAIGGAYWYYRSQP